MHIPWLCTQFYLGTGQEKLFGLSRDCASPDYINGREYGMITLITAAGGENTCVQIPRIRPFSYTHPQVYTVASELKFPVTIL